MLKNYFFKKKGFFAVLVFLIALSLAAYSFSLQEEQQSPAEPVQIKEAEKIVLQGARSAQPNISQNFVSCSTGWEKTETPNFFYCASKKKYEFCGSFELDGKKCNKFREIESGEKWVKLDLGDNRYRQMIFTKNTVFTEGSGESKEFVPFHEKHSLSVQNGNFDMQWGENNNETEFKISFGIDGEVFTTAGLKTLDAGIDVKTFAKNVGGGTKAWYEVQNVPQEIRDRLEFIKLTFEPQRGFERAQIKKLENADKVEAELPEKLNIDFSDLKENGFETEFENDYTLIVRAPQGGWGETISLDPVFQSGSASEDLYLYYKVITNRYDETALLKFDITSIPAGSTINSAVLQLYVNSESTDDDYTFYHLDQNQAWAESDSAANLRGMHKGTFQSATGCYNAVGDQNCAITTVFTASFDAGDSNFSVRIEDPDNNSSGVQDFSDNGATLEIGNSFQGDASFDSSEGTNPPVLFVDYTLANFTPSADVTKFDGYLDTSGLPFFSYERDGNLTIDFNVTDSDNDRLTVDINYSTSDSQGSGTVIYNDLNLTGAQCTGLDFTDATQCSVDFNIMSVSDGNYFIIMEVSDGTNTAFDAADNSFKIDNTAPAAQFTATPSDDVSLYINSTKDSHKAFMKFDVASIGSNAGIERSLLQLNVNVDSDDDDYTFYHTTNQSWTEADSVSTIHGMAIQTVMQVTNCYTSTGDQNCTITPVFVSSHDSGDQNFTIRIDDQDQNSGTVDTKSSSDTNLGTGKLASGVTLAKKQSEQIAKLEETNNTRTPNDFTLYFALSDYQLFDSSEGPNPPKLFVFYNTASVSSYSGQTGYTNDSTPALSLSSNDANAMAFSCDNSTYGAFVAAATTYSSFNVNTGAGCSNGDGNKTIYAKFQDQAGNITEASNTGSFVLDTANPSLSSPQPSSGTDTVDTTPDLNISFTETNPWYCTARPFVNGATQADSNATMSDGKCLYTHGTELSTNDTILVQFSMVDLAGNTSSDTNTGLYTFSAQNNAPDVNITRIDNYAVDGGLPFFSYERDGNLTIDFNVMDADNDTLTIDINYSSSAAQGTGTAIYSGLTLSATQCDDTDFTNSTHCSIDLNIMNISDGNYFIVLDVNDGSDANFDASDSSFAVDNTASSLSTTVSAGVLEDVRVYTTTGNSKSFIKFDLSSLSGLIVDYAKLQLNVNYAEDDGDYTFYHVPSQTWTESDSVETINSLSLGEFQHEWSCFTSTGDQNCTISSVIRTFNVTGDQNFSFKIDDPDYNSGVPDTKANDTNLATGTVEVQLLAGKEYEKTAEFGSEQKEAGSIEKIFFALPEYMVFDSSEGPNPPLLFITTKSIELSSYTGAVHYTNDTTPALSLKVNGSSDTNAMAFSCDNTTYSAYTTYATSYSSFNVKTGAGCTNEDGNKTIYAKFQDRAGNTSEADTTMWFIVDTNSPAIGSALPSTNSSTTDSTPDLNVSFSEPNPWYCTATPFVNGVAQADSNVTMSNGKCLYTHATELGGASTILVQFSMRDLAGNSSADLNTATFTVIGTAPDIYITKIDGYSDDSGLPAFGYERDGNLTIDFNVTDPNNDRLTIDINYSTSNLQGSGTALYLDLNLTGSQCTDLNFMDSTQCSLDLNTMNLSDNNYFVLVKVSDGSFSDFNASDYSFTVDNTGFDLNGSLAETPLEDVYVYDEIDGDFQEAQSFIKFDISPISSTSVINSAVLQLNVNEAEDRGQYNLYRIAGNSDWTENDSLSTFEGMSAGDLQYVDGCYASTGDQNCSIIDVFKAAQFAGDTNFSLRMQAPGTVGNPDTKANDGELKTGQNHIGPTPDSQGLWMTFDSSEGASPPKLFVDYIDAVKVSVFVGNTGYTTDSTPLLSLPSNDANAMAFSCDNATYGSYVAAATTYSSFNVNTGEGCSNGDGNKTVFVKFQDRAGNTSEPGYTDGFVLDTVGPVLGSVSPSTNTTTTNKAPSLSVGFTEANPWYCTATPFVNGVAQSDVNATISGSNCTYTPSTALSIGSTIFVQFSLTDRVANTSTDLNTGVYTIVSSQGEGGGGGIVCGDTFCQSPETCNTCPQDCGTCEGCGNNSCEQGETFYSCPSDCPQPIYTCGELNGTACNQTQACSGFLLNATDSQKCCSANCFSEPDLTLDVFKDTVIADKTTGNVVVTVYNNGGAAGEFEVEFREKTSDTNSSGSGKGPDNLSVETGLNNNLFFIAKPAPKPVEPFVMKKTITGLGAQNAVSIQFPISFNSSDSSMKDWLYKSKEFTVKVDSANVLAEKNELNNEKTLSVYFGGKEICGNKKDDDNDGETDEGCGVPDLFIKEIDYLDPFFDKTGQLVDTAFNVVIGSKYACARNFKLSFYRDSVSSNPLSTVVVDEVCPGEDASFSINYAFDDLRKSTATIFELQSIKTGVGKKIPDLIIFVDSDLEVEETTETNNLLNPVIRLADLRFLEFVAPATVFYPEAFEVSMVIDNNGVATAAPFNVGLFIGNEAQPVKVKRVEKLLSGASAIVSFEVDSAELAAQTSLPKEINFSVVIDFDAGNGDEVAEKNEFNNEKTGSFDIVDSVTEFYTYDSLVEGEKFWVGFWSDKESGPEIYSFSFDGLPATVADTIVLGDLSSSRDFVIFELDSPLAPQVLPYSFSIEKSGAEVFSGSFTVSQATLREIYNKANDTSLLLKVDPRAVRRMHYERVKMLNSLWWSEWFYG